MEAIAYVFILACLLGLFFFAIFFREPPRITKD
ncbi:photosystem II reaction center protein T [Altericista sp. CCNU0014]